MKQSGKKFTALLVSAVMAFGLGVTSNAAAATDVYSVSTGSKQVLFVKNGVTTGTFNTKEEKPSITLSTNKDGSLLVGFVDDTGKALRVSLGSQSAVTLDGEMTALTLDKSLNKAVVPTVGATASVGKMNVAAANSVAINGMVTTLDVSAAANVTIASTATVTKKNVTNKNAKVSTSKNTAAATTTPAATVKPSTTATPKIQPKTTTTKTTGTGTVKLTVKQIYSADKDTTLEDLEGELASAVRAYDSATKEDIPGTCSFTQSGGTTISDDRSVGFTFTPDDSSYASVKGMVTINVDTAAGEITLEGNDEPLDFGSEGDKLKDYTKDLNSQVYAVDENGKDVEGKCTWNSSTSTTVDEGDSFQFTFTPSNSRYDKATGRIQIGSK